ncbi:MAG TPA: Ig-like domain-containing protein [Gemmatimonadaceae bacterium]|nr:Ig-like domain-containing protein [Gemmatimonadaceae bacterium]
MNRLLTCGATAFALLNILSCSDATAPDALGADDLSADAARIIGSIQVTLASSSIDSGETTQATAAVYDRRGRPMNRSVIWSSSNVAVATVSDSGLVLGVSPGTAVITASHNDHSGSATVTVNRVGSQTVTPVASVMVALAATSIAIGQSTQGTATERDSAGNVLTGRTITWASSDSSVAIVSSAGLVTGLKAGSAQILATSEGKSGSAGLTVTSGTTTNPGRVSDLKVVSADSTSVALSFTQVDDGTGQPAEYDVRYAISPISWGSATWTTKGTCTTPVAGTGIGAPLNCTVAGLSSSTRYDFQVIAFRGTLNQNAVFGSLSNIATATTTASSSQTPPPPSGSVEPPGLTTLTERPFSALNEDGWTNTGTRYYTIQTDATAPQSPSSVGQILFPAGFGSGNAPAVLEKVWASGIKTLYVSFWLKMSSNWVGNDAGVNKIFHFWIGDSNRLFLNAHGAGNGTLTAEVWLQRIVAGGNFDNGTTADFAPNLGVSAVIARGKWVHWEMLLTANSSGTKDGKVEWWINGQKVGSYSGIQFVSGAGTWQEMEWSPTYGGFGNPVPVNQTMSIDHIRVSGK